jgi:lipopolysaccharide biosynthesis protein
MPVKFDLFITTNSKQKKNAIENMLQRESKANKYEINLVSNKGRDVLPFLTQVRNVMKKYKYICHIHTKKTKFNPTKGEKWRKYLYNNLFGDKELISEILSDFENNKKLGVVFPETYYPEKENVLKYNGNNIKYMNHLLKIMFPNKDYKIGNKIIFPSGNMFWARINAIHQMFEHDISNKCPKEANQYDATILHGVERLWLFVAKLNGYYYKTIFKYL